MSTSAIISIDGLASRLQQPDLVVLDCRYDLGNSATGEQAYREGHIPSAAYASLDRDLSGPTGRYGGRHPLPTPEQFQAFARSVGINRDSLVVVYDEQRLAFAARAWWLLRYFGHEQVMILDGGIGAWRRAGRELESGDYKPAELAGNFIAEPHRQAIIAHEEIYPNLNSPPWQLIDAREPRRFSGLEEPIDPLAGHIPGAVNKPWQQITDDQGMLKSRSELLAHWDDIPADDSLVSYCGSGVTACVNLLSLHLIGREGARLYPGSWSDWCAHILHPQQDAEPPEQAQGSAR